MPRERVQSLARAFDTDAGVWRLRNPPTFNTPFGEVKPNFEHAMQLIESDSLEPIIALPGGALLSKVPAQEVYILSDPDVLNTFGLARRENARFALGLMDYLAPYADGAVTLDATLHGFERSESLLRAIFDIPFLGATLLALATGGLIGWAAFSRFGPTDRESRILAYGKQALADNSAGLVSMTRREGKMAPGYAHMSRRALIRRLGLPRNISDKDLSRTLNALAKKRELDQGWETLNAGLSKPANSREDLTHKASALWAWRKELTHGD